MERVIPSRKGYLSPEEALEFPRKKLVKLIKKGKMTGKATLMATNDELARKKMLVLRGEMNKQEFNRLVMDGMQPCIISDDAVEGFTTIPARVFDEGTYVHSRFGNDYIFLCSGAGNFMLRFKEIDDLKKYVRERYGSCVVSW